MAVFALPVNCCLNPIIYTMMTPEFRSMIRACSRQQNQFGAEGTALRRSMSCTTTLHYSYSLSLSRGGGRTPKRCKSQQNEQKKGSLRPTELKKINQSINQSIDQLIDSLIDRSPILQGICLFALFSRFIWVLHQRFNSLYTDSSKFHGHILATEQPTLSSFVQSEHFVAIACAGLAARQARETGG
jgi:hypothetical protein